MDFFIRRATESDASLLADIITRSWKAAYIGLLPPAELHAAADKNRYAAAFEAMTKAPENRFSLAFDKETPCGMLLYCPARDSDLSEYAEIVACYFLQEYWGTGAARQLFQTALTEIAAQYGGASVWVFKDNTRARRFYEKFGFSADGKEKQENFSNNPLSVRYIKSFKE